MQLSSYERLYGNRHVFELLHRELDFGREQSLEDLDVVWFGVAETNKQARPKPYEECKGTSNLPWASNFLNNAYCRPWALNSHF